MNQPLQSAQRFSPERARSVMLRASFHQFVIKAFKTLHPATGFVPEWHIELVCREVMDFLSSPDDMHLVVNLPPRSLKSIILSVALPACLLGKNPAERILCVSYNGPLANQMARDALAVMTASWYRELFPRTTIARNPEEGIFTTMRGYRRSTSIGGTVTGLGANIIIVDDPIKPEDALSDPTRDKTNSWITSTLLSRANDKRTAKVVLAMQRVHHDDPTATFLKPILIEDKVSGTSVADDLRDDDIGVVRIQPEANKKVRASIASDQIEAGNVYIPRHAEWLDEFLAEVAAFPAGRHDDQVDSMAQAIIWNQEKTRNPGTAMFGHY